MDRRAVRICALIITAKYKFFWYELDLSIKVGLTDEFYFFKDREPLEFYNGPFYKDEAMSISCRIEKIIHPELGEISEIDTKGLDYTITLANGESLKVEAEEKPGDVYDFRIKPENWLFDVQIKLERPGK